MSDSVKDDTSKPEDCENTDPGIPAEVEGEATKLIKMTLKSLEDGIQTSRAARISAKRIRTSNPSLGLLAVATSRR